MKACLCLTLLLLLEDPFLDLFFVFCSFKGGRGEKVDGTAEKIEVKREQFEKIIHGKIIYVHKNRSDNYK